MRQVEVLEQRIDPGHRRQPAARGVLEKAGTAGIKQRLLGELDIEWQLRTLDIREPVTMLKQILVIRAPQGPERVAVPAPGYPGGIQVPHERGHPIDRRT